MAGWIWPLGCRLQTPVLEGVISLVKWKMEIYLDLVTERKLNYVVAFFQIWERILPILVSESFHLLFPLYGLPSSRPSRVTSYSLSGSQPEGSALR